MHNPALDWQEKVHLTFKNDERRIGRANLARLDGCASVRWASKKDKKIAPDDYT
jgi:hypothetical protein